LATLAGLHNKPGNQILSFISVIGFLGEILLYREILFSFDSSKSLPALLKK
jgi:hypothetical protein